ncbi:MAG: DNA replication and repair protein RecF [Chromatiaceae bacterium]|nr:DNA replication and repair protein RecF [Chromatiaceae bacterium]
MRLENLKAQRLRAISEAELSLSPGVNWIVGGNAAGKTTLLEAVFLLGRGKSFRGARYGGLVQHGHEEAWIEADVVHGLRRRRIGVKKSREGTVWWENGVRRCGVDDLGVRVHVRMIGENAQRLVEGDPGLRRWFVDWNLFHVEPGYGELLSDFRRALGQRNAWLQEGGRGRPVWDAPYVAAAEALSRARRSFVEALAGAIGNLPSQCGLGAVLVADLSQGWPCGESLAARLEQALPSDVARGYTWYGPARADLSVRLEGRRALGSRGENKMTVAVLQLAAQRIWAEKGIECVWLIDDLASELSREGTAALWDSITRSGSQVLATALEPPAFPGAVFHVKRGRVLPGP